MSYKETSDPIQFRLVETLPSVIVSAKHCLWFTWAEDDYEGPYHEKGIEFRPKHVVIPGDIEFVNIRVTNPGDIWWHGSQEIEKSTADGRSKQQGLADPRYRNDAQYNASNIHPIETNLNKLVALVGTDEPPSSLVEPIPVGVLLNSEPIPGAGSPRNLYFGMHDAFQWTNNGGATMSVEVDLLEKIAMGK